ncbi:MAG: DMT family transporter [Alphaproteobacteria bacterium]
MFNVALYATTVLTWGLTWYAVNLQIGGVAPEWSLVYRFGAAGLMLLAWAGIGAWRTGRRLPRLSPRQHAALALLALFIFSTNYLLFYWATHFMASGLVAVVFSTATLFNIVNGALFLGQPMTLRAVGAALLGVGGLAVVFLPELTTVGTDSLVGLGLSLVATYSFSLGNVISSRSQTGGVPVTIANGFSMTYGAGLVAAYAAVVGSTPTLDVNPTYLGSLAYLILFGTIIGFYCYLTLLGRIGAARTAYTTVLIPLIALAVSAMFEGYQWTPVAAGGVLLVLAGNVLALRSRGPAAAAAVARSPAR